MNVPVVTGWQPFNTSDWTKEVAMKEAKTFLDLAILWGSAILGAVFLYALIFLMMLLF